MIDKELIKIALNSSVLQPILTILHSVTMKEFTKNIMIERFVKRRYIHTIGDDLKCTNTTIKNHINSGIAAILEAAKTNERIQALIFSAARNNSQFQAS